MQNYSFEKGDLFENYILDNLFTDSDYDLVYRTNSYVQNEIRFSEYTLKPDFKFRCKKTQKEFYVEAKFRSGFNADNKIDVISYSQIERFKVYQKEENIPIFILVGYGNTPENPAHLSLIPLKELTYLDLYGTFLRRYDVKKETINSNILNLNSDPETRGFETSDKQSLKKAANETYKEWFSAFFNRNKKRIVASSVGLLIIILLLMNIGNFSNSSNRSTNSIVAIEETLQKRIKDYYETIHSGNIDALENFINPVVDTWYSRSNLTFEEIKKDAKAYNRRHPFTNTNIQWETFKVIPLKDGYSVSYNMIYKLLKENKGKDKIFHLRIHAIWDKKLKLKSLYEEKI